MVIITELSLILPYVQRIDMNLCCSSIFPLLLVPQREGLLNLILILVEVGCSPGEDADANEANGNGGEGRGGGLHHLRGHHLAQPLAQPEHRYVLCSQMGRKKDGKDFTWRDNIQRSRLRAPLQEQGKGTNQD